MTKCHKSQIGVVMDIVFMKTYIPSITFSTQIIPKLIAFGFDFQICVYSRHV